MIEEIRIQNYKSIADVTVKLSPTTVLVGRSGTGKSNFVQAVRFFRDTLKDQNSGVQEWETSRPVPKSEKDTRFDIRFSIDGVDGAYRYTLAFNASGPQSDLQPAQQAGLEEESLYLGDACLFHQKRKKVQPGFGSPAQWTQEPPLVDVPNSGTVALGRLPSLSEAVVAFTALTDGIGCYTFPNSVTTGNQQSPNAQAGFNDIGGNFLSTMKKIVSDIQDLSARKKIVAALKRVNDGVVSVELDSLQKPANAIVGHQFESKRLGLNLSQESEGFRRVFAHLLALYQRPPKLLLLFEHPEDGIHPGALSLLADEFKAAPAEGRGQILMTTHSPGLLDNFSAEEIRVVERQGFYTKIGPLSDEQRESLHDDLLEPGELLTVDPARLNDESPEVDDE